MGYPRTFEQAVVYGRTVASQVRQNKEVRRRRLKPDAAVDALLETIQSSVPKGRYRSFDAKGESVLYDVLGIVEEVVTGHCYVQVVPCSGLRQGKPELWILIGTPRAFLEPVDTPEYQGVRFTRLPDDDDVLRI